MAMRLPRSARSWSREAARRSWPSKVTLPSTTRPGWSTRPMTDRNVTLLPEPDSPTRPSTSPFCTVRSTPSTALTTPSAVKNHAQAAHLQQRLARLVPGLLDGVDGLAHLFSLGSRASRRPSPMRLKASTFSMIIRPG